MGSKYLHCTIGDVDVDQNRDYPSCSSKIEITPEQREAALKAKERKVRKAREKTRRDLDKAMDLFLRVRE